MHILKKILVGITLASLSLTASPAFAASESIQGRASGNWAGYVASAKGDYSAVGATWVVPTVEATTTLMTDVTWIGIGGSKSKDLIQTGTHGAVKDGKTQYWAWYEMLPDYQQIIPLDVHAGDSISASLTEISDGLWYLSFENLTTGKRFFKTLEYRSRNTSAEWIEEMPVVYDKDGVERIYAPLSNFGTVTFDNAYAVVNGKRVSLEDTRASAVTMVANNNRRIVLATPSDSVQDSFSVTRSSAVPSPVSTKAGKRAKSSYEIFWSKVK